ncbi:hypothetical protein IQ257_23720 [Coleofasciculus sp. LEGE 07092]|nr:hypothetical protein [Coleofasciculus sp. LEGE 07081]MBE9151439.1 hypothetical protein [Coleofasciculus sp. LEGE 07092]
MQSEQTIQPIQLVTPPQTQIESPSTWMRDGNSPAEIILAIAVLIGAIATLLNVLVPVMLQQSQK